MKVNQWTIGLVAGGLVSLAAVAPAEEAQHQVLTALSSTTLSGYVATSAIWKFGTGDLYMPGRTSDGGIMSPGGNKQDGFNLDAINLTLEKPVSEGNWGAGYKVELLAGPDATAYSAIASGGIGTGAAIKQAYVDLKAPLGNGLDVKVGVYDNILGYEVYNEGSNPNFSRSYAFAIEPLQHTGVIATYTFADWLSASVGVANTLNSAINGRPYRAIGQPATESEKSYMGIVTLTAPDSMGWLKGATLSAAVENGLNGIGFAGPNAVSDITAYYVGATLPTPIKGFSIGGAYDYRGTKQNDAISSATYANAVSLYLMYQATEKLKLANRAEYASGSNGTWATTRPAGISDEFFGETLTVDYSLWANVISRLEFRWDHDLSGGPGVFGGDPRSPAPTLNKNALSLALNLIYKF